MKQPTLNKGSPHAAGDGNWNFSVRWDRACTGMCSGQASADAAGEVALKVHLRREPFELDFPLEFPDEVWTHWLEEKQEQFGERWPVVQRVLWDFESLDIYLLDVSPRNIAFRD